MTTNGSLPTDERPPPTHLRRTYEEQDEGLADIRQEWLTLQRAEELFCVPVATWRRWLREGRLGFSRLGGRILIRRADVEAWLARNFREGAGAAQSQSARRVPSQGGESTVDPTSILARLLGAAGGVASEGG